MVFGRYGCDCYLHWYPKVCTFSRGLKVGQTRIASVASYADRIGSKIIGEYEEAETPRRDGLKNRPQLRAALSHARRSGVSF